MATAKQVTNKDERGVPRTTVTTIHVILPQVFVGETLSAVEVIRSEEGMQVPNGCHYALDTQKNTDRESSLVDIARPLLSHSAVRPG